MKDQTSILVLSRSTPPRSGGTPSILANQFSWIDEKIVFVGTKPGINETKNNFRNNWTFYGIDPIKKNRYFPGIEWFAVFRIVFCCLKAIKKHKSRAIILILLDERYMLAGLVLKKISRKPLILYVQDFYTEGLESKIGINAKRFQKWLEKCLFSSGDYFVTNIPLMPKHYGRKYGVNMKLVTNCYSKDVQTAYSEIPPVKLMDEKHVVAFCGSIYKHNVTNLKNLCIAMLSMPNYKLKIFTSHSPDQLNSMGLIGNIEIEFISDTVKLIEELAKCDILFLPFTFDTKYRTDIIHAFPTKVLDYVISGRPIILNVHPESYLYEYFTSNNAAHVIADNTPESLLISIERLIHSPSYATMLSQNSFNLSKEFQGPGAVRNLKQIIESIPY